MQKAARLLILYVIGIVLLSSIDVTYEWLSPLEKREDAAAVEWYATGGLRQGLLLLGNHEPPGAADGLSLGVHVPKFFLVPFYAGAGPEGGGVILSVWFVGLIIWIIHALWAWPRLELLPE